MMLTPAHLACHTDEKCASGDTLRDTLTTTPFGTPILQAIAACREASAAHEPTPPAPCPFQPGDEVLIPPDVLAGIGRRSEAWERQRNPPPVALPTGSTGIVCAISPERRCATMIVLVSFPDGRGERTVSVEVRLDRLIRPEPALPAPD